MKKKKKKESKKRLLPSYGSVPPFWMLYFYVSYTDVGSYQDGKEFFKKAFCIEVNSDGFLL